MPLVRAARRRTEHFPNRAETIEAYRGRSLFHGWLPEVFDDYWDAALVDNGSGGWTLRYPRNWEARVFRVSPHNAWPQLRPLQTPSLFVQGSHSDTFTRTAVRRVRREVPGARLAILDGHGHCVPMENPELVGETVLEFAAEVLG
jgi:pimeloyl-ACP methyl ester carboxylesterase